MIIVINTFINCLGVLWWMLSKPLLRAIVEEQHESLPLGKSSIPRTILPFIQSYRGNAALVIKGVRRCGKSTLLQQLIQTKYPADYFYFNFDDERLGGFTAEDFQGLMELGIERFGEKKNLFFDEIQNVRGWELFINRVLREGHSVFITGSNADLLSQELGTHLTGRHVDLELYPFSFAEFLHAKGIPLPPPNVYTTSKKAVLSAQFREYLIAGGMPEAVVLFNDYTLLQIVNDVLQKDVVSRYQIRKPIELKSVARLLIANVSNLITYRSLSRNFGINNNTIQKYIDYLEQTYLFFTVKRFDRKIKRLDKNPKKIYCVDNGIVTKNMPNIIENKGSLLENTVAIHLKRTGKEFYYYVGKSGNNETDFVIPAERMAIQVCYDLNEENKKRETKALLESMNEMESTAGIILTMEQEDEIEINKKRIIVKPVWQWLLENETAYPARNPTRSPKS